MIRTMPATASSPHRPWQLPLIAAALYLLLGFVTYTLLFSTYLDRERQQASQRLDAFALSLEATLVRHESLPGLLALDPSLLALLRAPEDKQRITAANAYLEAAQQSAVVAATYLIDINGKTLAASNWRQPLSFIGHNYAFRPYFNDAIKNGIGRFYGVGVTTGAPGYFLAAPVHDQGHVLGVVVLKVGLESMEQALSSIGDTMLLSDADGIVFLSSERRLRYKSLAELPTDVASRLAETKQYGSQAIQAIAKQAIPIEGSDLFHLAMPNEAAREHFLVARPVGNFGWQVIQLGNPKEARGSAFSGAAALAFAGAFCIGLIAHFRHRSRRREELRRIYAELETRIAEQTADLTDKVKTLQQTEAILRETQDSAVQAGKLAVLGQMSAGISHELNQPLAALQTFADNATALLSRGRYEEVAENLQMISTLIDRTGRIVRQLKTFARKEASTPQAVTVASAIEHAQIIVEPRRKETSSCIVIHPFDHSLLATAEAGRLEQVLVNLLRNGIDAMLGQSEPCLEVTVRQANDTICIEVRDHGPGLPEEVLHHLFEPFYTTKPAGEGLGLGLAISLTIVEGYGGTLSAHNATDGGAIFTLTLPAAKPTKEV